MAIAGRSHSFVVVHAVPIGADIVAVAVVAVVVVAMVAVVVVVVTVLYLHRTMAEVYSGTFVF